MGKTLYLDCTNGISGDMTVAALLDLGANEARLRDALASLPVSGYEVHISRVKKAGIDCCDFDVVLDAAHENHDHDMAYLHGESGERHHSRDHVCCHEHTHAYLAKDGNVEITCGCFRGSIDEFEKKVEETHSGTIYETQYKAIINVIKIKFGIE